MLPFITVKLAFRPHVRELVFGVNKFDLDFGVQMNLVKQTVKRNPVASGYMSQCWTSF